MRRPRARIALAVVLLALAAGESAGVVTIWQAGNLQPLVVGWQQFFRVQWDEARVDGRPIVQGYITNVWGFTARKVQLLVNGYDESGARIGQLLAWGPSPITPGSRVYFDVSVPPAASYEVAVFAWDWVQTDGGRRLLRP
jgi:hypothetical protein